MKAVQSKETTNDDAQIRAIIEDYGEGLRNKDADRCVSHYADDLVQFDLAPPHNEIDPNLCGGNAGQYGGVNAPCSMFARYMLSGILEVRPFGKGPLRRFMVYGAPTFLFGKTVPKTLYTWSFDPIGIEHSWGAGIYLNKGFEFRVTQHFLFDR